MTIFDRALWHSEGDYPDDLAPERAATHIGMYLAWCAEQRLSRPLAGETARDLSERRLTPAAFAENAGNEAVDAALLTTEGEAFTEDYYDNDGDETRPSYLDDYIDVFWDDGETIYHVADTWQNYARITPLLTRRLAEWRAERPSSAVVDEAGL